MAGPLMLLASPLAIVAYYMLASVLTSYIAVRLIRTWGLVGRLAAAFSRKERLPISLPDSSTPPTSPWKEHAHANYVEWMAKLLTRLKVPIPKLPHLAQSRIELPILKEDETIQLEEARLEVEEPRVPPPLVDLGDAVSPMLGLFAGASNVSACPTPEPRLHRHLPSPIPWRPGTTPPISGASPGFPFNSQRLPTTPPPTFIPLSPYSSPKLKGRQRESFEMGTFSQPLIQFSPVASPVPRALFPHDQDRTPSPVHHRPRFLSASPPAPYRPRAMSFGGAPSFEASVEERMGATWESGRSGLLIDLERLNYDSMQPMKQYEVPAPIKPQPISPISFDLLGQVSPQRDGARDLFAKQEVDDAGCRPKDEPASFNPVPATVPTASQQQDGEFGLFDNPFNTDSTRVSDPVAPPSLVLNADRDLDVEAAVSPSSLTSTPVVVEYTDAMPTLEESTGPSGPVAEEMPLECLEEPLRSFDGAHSPPPALEGQGYQADDEEMFPDPEDLPLPLELEVMPRFPDPDLLELPSTSYTPHEAGFIILLCSLVVVGHDAVQDTVDEDPHSLKFEEVESRVGDVTTAFAAPSLHVATKLKDEREMDAALVTPSEDGLVIPVPEDDSSIERPDYSTLETPVPSMKACPEIERPTVEESPEPVTFQGSSPSDKDKDSGPTSVSEASPPSTPSSTANPSKTRQRALSGGFTATIVETWRRGKTSPLDVALAMQMRPGLGVGADPAFMVRFLMAAFGWFVIVVNGGID